MEERETEAGRPEEPPERGGRRAPEAPERPAPGVEVEPEPDAENIMPAEDRPGTF